MNHNTIDMVLSLNGIPLVAFELKNQLKGQDYTNAINQFKFDRNPKELSYSKRNNNQLIFYF